MCFKIIGVLFLFFLGFGTQAQDCFEYHLTQCNPIPSKYTYQINNESISYKFASGEVRLIPFTLLQGKDYRITLCADNAFENIIQIVLKSQTGRILYDNSTQNYNLNLEFANKKTQEIFIELKAPDAVIGASDTIYIEGCIGLLIEEMVSVRTGF